MDGLEERFTILDVSPRALWNMLFLFYFMMDFQGCWASKLGYTIKFHNTMLVYGVGNQRKSLKGHFSLFFTFVRRASGWDILINTFLFNSSYLQPFWELDHFFLLSDTIYVCPWRIHKELLSFLLKIWKKANVREGSP